MEGADPGRIECVGPDNAKGVDPGRAGGADEYRTEGVDAGGREGGSWVGPGVTHDAPRPLHFGY